MHRRRLSLMVIAGVGVVVATAALAWPGGGASPRPDAPATVAAASERPQLGIRGKEVDPARRSRAAEDAGGAAPAVTPSQPRAPKPPSDAPSPPPLSVVAGADDLAAAETALAARPAVLASVDAALASRRDDLRRRCWTGDAGAAVSLPIEVSYSAGGDLQTLRVLDATREAAAVGACVREQPSLVPATIDPPGVRVTVEASLTLP